MAVTPMAALATLSSFTSLAWKDPIQFSALGDRAADVVGLGKRVRARAQTLQQNASQYAIRLPLSLNFEF